MAEIKSLTINETKYDSFPDLVARENSHSHANNIVINKLTENTEGKLLFDGVELVTDLTDYVKINDLPTKEDIISDIENDLAELQVSHTLNISTINEAISGLTQTHSTDINTLNNNIAALAQTHNTDMQAVNTSIETHSSDIEALNNLISTLTATIGELSTRIETLESQQTLELEGGDTE